MTLDSLAFFLFFFPLVTDCFLYFSLVTDIIFLFAATKKSKVILVCCCMTTVRHIRLYKGTQLRIHGEPSLSF
jgi:hypothetical protein